MYKYLLLILFQVISLTALAQHPVSGQVQSAATGEVIAGATTRLADGSKGTVSDANGKFSITIPKDTATLYISFIGFKTQKLRVKWPVIKPLTIQLEQSSSLLDEVTVSTG